VEVSVPAAVGRALSLAAHPGERAKVSSQQYRDVLEQGILDIPRDISTLAMDYGGEPLTLRLVLALFLAEDLAGTPLRATDAADAINWYREFDAVRESAPRAWAIAQHNTGLAWLRRRDTERQAAARHAIEALQNAATVRAADGDPADWASTVLALTDAYRELEPDGLAQAIASLEQAIRDAPPGLPDSWRRRLTADLGGCLARRGDRAGSAADLDAAIGLLEPLAAERRPDDPEVSLSAAVNLGFTYGLRAERGARGDWPRAVAVLEDALAVRERDGNAEGWAEAANNLGIILMHSPDGDRAANLARARQLFERVSEITLARGEMSAWAGVQNNLGTVLRDTPTGDRDERIDLACRAYERALTVWTKRAHPLEWALTTARLAGAESERAGADRAKISALYKAALDGLDVTKQPLSWARVANRYAGTIADQGEADAPGTGPRDRPAADHALQTSSLREAIKIYTQAVEVFDAQGSRFDAASAEHNRALAAWRLAARSADTAWFDAARRGFERARELRLADEVPRDWAMTTMMLGELEVAAGRAYAAEPLLEEALAVLLDGGETALVLRASAGLARLRAANGAWEQAAGAFEVSLRAIDELFSSATARSSKERALEQASGVLVDAVFAMAAAGRVPDAGDTLEHGRGRLLADALRLRTDPFEALAGRHPEAYQRYRQDAEDLQRAEAASLRLAADHDPGGGGQYRRQAESEVRRELRAARERLAASTAALRSLLTAADEVTGDAGTTVAYLLTTAWGSLSLVADGAGTRPVWAPEYRAPDLDAALRGTGGSPGLLRAVGLGSAAIDRALASLLPQAGLSLLGPLGDHLRETGCDEVTLVCCGGLSQLPLHAAPYGDATFGDHFVVSYAPSRTVLSSCTATLADRRQRPGSPAFAVVNPTGGLRYAACESAHLLARVPGTSLEGPAARRAAVRAAWTGSGLALFACHGRSVADDPLQSHLLLADGELSLLDLSVGTRTPAAPWLVLASACQSATVDVRRLPDEFVGLPTGFLVSGVATFIGTLWPTGDVPAALMTMRIIELMFPRDPSAEALSPARALQRARAWLRNLTGAEFTRFAASSRSLQEVARTQLAFAARYPSGRPYAAPSAWAPHVLIGTGGPQRGEAI
jgi:CHAT domain-containing protein/tetratricopeptide (TPR) repeat protein